MTPRAQVASTGLPGLGQTIFPEEAKEFGRSVGLRDTAVIYRNTPTDDGGGSPIENWKADSTAVRAIIEPLGKRPPGAGQTSAGKMAETATHVISFDPGTDIDPSCRVEIAGKMWIVTGRQRQTLELIVKVEAKELI